MDQDNQELIDTLADAVNQSSQAVDDLANAVTLWIQSLPPNVVEYFKLDPTAPPPDLAKLFNLAESSECPVGIYMLKGVCRPLWDEGRILEGFTVIDS